MSSITAEAIELLEILPEADQLLALNLIKQVVNAWSIENEIPNAETLAALEEAKEMEAHPERYKRYSTFREALDEVLHET